MMGRNRSSPDTTATLQSAGFTLPSHVPSMFTGHQLQPDDFGTARPHRTQPDWIFAVLLICFVLIAWARVFYHKRLHQVFLAPFSRRFINQLMRDGNLFRERVAIALGIVYVMTFALLLYQWNEMRLGFIFNGIPGPYLYLLIIMTIIGGLTAKVTLVNVLGIIFRTKETTYNYLLNLMIFALVTGPVLLAALVFIVYLQSVLLLYICLGIYLLLFSIQFIKGFFIGLTLTKFSYLFLFVYLCSLEILPFLVLVKILFNFTHATGV